LILQIALNLTSYRTLRELSEGHFIVIKCNTLGRNIIQASALAGTADTSLHMVKLAIEWYNVCAREIATRFQYKKIET